MMVDVMPLPRVEVGEGADSGMIQIRRKAVVKIIRADDGMIPTPAITIIAGAMVMVYQTLGVSVMILIQMTAGITRRSRGEDVMIRIRKRGASMVGINTGALIVGDMIPTRTRMIVVCVGNVKRGREVDDTTLVRKRGASMALISEGVIVIGAMILIQIVILISASIKKMRGEGATTLIQLMGASMGRIGKGGLIVVVAAMTLMMKIMTRKGTKSITIDVTTLLTTTTTKRSRHPKKRKCPRATSQEFKHLKTLPKPSANSGSDSERNWRSTSQTVMAVGRRYTEMPAARNAPFQQPTTRNSSAERRRRRNCNSAN
mmetsp:Transcript_239/g.413  ORF Transcript_239/g.413 Transcript_239/m.413 type:complete len:316 (+) Transcript_239:257-1204(+)